LRRSVLGARELRLYVPPSGASPAHSPTGLTAHSVAQFSAAHAPNAFVSFRQAAGGLHVSTQQTAARPHPQ
jgi:hypothetical protein